jgi:hypothetical protein
MFSQGLEDNSNLNIFKNIRRSKLYKVTTHAIAFSCIEAISWIFSHVNLETKYILNVRDHPITSFQASNIASFYHLDKGERSIDKNMIKEFPLKVKDMFKIWYKPIKPFKSRPSSAYPTNLLRMLYKYVVVMLCRLCEELDASKFPMTRACLIYNIANIGSTFNWDDILSTSLEETIKTVKETVSIQFHSFHMSSYILDMVCFFHTYSHMGWAWYPTNPPIHIYCKVLLEHK